MRWGRGAGLENSKRKIENREENRIVRRGLCSFAEKASSRSFRGRGLLAKSAFFLMLTKSRLSSRKTLGEAAVLASFGITINRSLLLFGDGDGGAGGFPVQIESGSGTGLFESDGEILDWSRQRGGLHVHAREIVGLAGVSCSPFAGLLANDQRPLVLAGNRKQGIGAGRNRRAANVQVHRGRQRGGFVGTGTPDLIEGNDTAVNLAGLDAGTGVINGDGFSAAEVPGGLRGRASALGFVLLSRGHKDYRKYRGHSRNDREFVFHVCSSTPTLTRQS